MSRTDNPSLGRVSPRNRAAMSDLGIPADLDAALRARYGDRPDTLKDVLANAEAWERLKAKCLVDEPITKPLNAKPSDGPIIL